MGATYPLPRLAACPLCAAEIRVRRGNRLFAHDKPHDPLAPIICDEQGYAITRCPAGGREVTELLEPTFARWLHSHSARRDVYTNVVAQLAKSMFRGCGRSPWLTAADVPWSSADELHDHLHALQLERTGSDIRQEFDGQRCDWRCRQVERAAAHYEQLLAREQS
ncbi:hypothetical protein [Streptomyces sp. NPDC096153]|uniref:hypothetical protein n=1 Tax=Streptomyces sp. NPDC096153 TaxID=3155548 RepID=UPI00331DF007